MIYYKFNTDTQLAYLAQRLQKGGEKINMNLRLDLQVILPMPFIPLFVTQKRHLNKHNN